MVNHTIFGAGAPPWEPTAHNDGDPSITTAVAFYSTATTWSIVGARCRIPVGGGAIFPDQVTMELRIVAVNALVDLSTAPSATATATVAEGWCEGLFPSGVTLTVGSVGWISLRGIVDQDVYLFVGVGTVGVGFIQASDGSDLYLAEAGTTPGAEQPRSAFRTGTDPTTLSQAWYGLDIIADDGQRLSGATITGTGSITATGSVDSQKEGSASIAGTASLAAAGLVTGAWCEPLTVEVVAPTYTVETIAPTYTVDTVGRNYTVEVLTC